MPGGSGEAYASVGPLLETIAAQVDGTPCCTHVGPDGAGHFVKMVHNGIEYSDMQLIAESYDLLRQAPRATPAELAAVFRDWNTGELESYLIGITAEVLEHVDAATGRPFVDIVLDEAEQKGTGRWGVQSALDLGVPVTGIAEAVFARSLSAEVSPATRPPRHCPGRRTAGRGRGRPDALVEDVRRRPVRLEDRRLRAGLRPDRRRQRRVRLGHRPGAPWPPSGGVAASSGPASSTASGPRTTPTRDLPTLLVAPSFTEALADAQDAVATRGGHGRVDSGCRRRASRRRWRTTTRCAATACRRR